MIQTIFLESVDFDIPYDYLITTNKKIPLQIQLL